MGLAFKREIDDARNSLSYKAIKILRRQMAEVKVHDPYLAPGELSPLLAEADLVLVCTNHRAYQELGLEPLRAAGPTLVADIWNVFGRGRVFFRAPDDL
jgi:UDP-N-acetyl-D-mannosaminuronate dehydrogenase